MQKEYNDWTIRYAYYIVYQILCVANNKKYIGLTYFYDSRRKSHLSALRIGRHPNKELQSDFNMYGEPYFRFDVIRETEDTELGNKIERELILSLPNLYNIKKYAI